MRKIKYPCLLLIGEKYGKYVVNISSEQELFDFSLKFAQDKINIDWFYLDEKYNPDISFEEYFQDCYGISIEKVENILSTIGADPNLKAFEENKYVNICLENKMLLKANWHSLKQIKRHYLMGQQHYINTKSFFEAVEKNDGSFAFKYLRNHFENSDGEQKFILLESSNYSKDTNFTIYDLE